MTAPGDNASELDAAMDRYADGDDRAFAVVYDLLAPRLMAFLRKSVRDAALVEDLTQATLLQMHRARGQFLRGSAVLPWAFAIARRLLIDDLRKNKHAAKQALGDDLLVSLAGTEASPLAAFEASQLAAVVDEALAAMPEAHRTAFRLLKVDGLSVAESAELIGASETTIKMRAHRAYEHLRAAIEARFGRAR